MCQQGPPDASQGVVQASTRRELSHMSPWQSRIRRCGSAKAACKCGEVGSGYTEPKGWVVGSGWKRSRTIQRSVKLWISGHRGRERVGLELLRGQSTIEPIPVQRNDHRKPNGCNNAVDWVDIANSKLLLAANTESNSTDSAALERPSLPECAYATATGQLMLPMPYKITAWILGVVVFVGIGQYLVGPVEAWMRNANVWIAVGFNTTVQLYWDGGLIEHNLAPFWFVIPRDQVVPAA
ncbi:hypothetical protein EDB86DRAFT_2836715 [Lactarius hatsudake]|nr:hypothetical protein EDB86DRAFT_2836715 [Lactarius hatsudake]